MALISKQFEVEEKPSHSRGCRTTQWREKVNVTLHRFLFVVVVLMMVPSFLEAQQPAVATRPDTTALTFDREVFTYPQYSRRNPFTTLLADGDGGPRFERLLLLGIFYSDDPTESLALFAEGTRTVTPAEPGVPESVTVEVTGGTYQVRNGESVGNVTVVRIDRLQV